MFYVTLSISLISSGKLRQTSTEINGHKWLRQSLNHEKFSYLFNFVQVPKMKKSFYVRGNSACLPVSLSIRKTCLLFKYLKTDVDRRSM